MRITTGLALGPMPTHWRASGVGGTTPHGTLWRAAKALDDYSVATMDSSGLLAQFNAGRFGMGSEAETAILIPIIPVIPNKIMAKLVISANQVPSFALVHPRTCSVLNSDPQ